MEGEFADYIPPSHFKNTYRETPAEVFLSSEQNKQKKYSHAYVFFKSYVELQNVNAK